LTSTVLNWVKLGKNKKMSWGSATGPSSYATGGFDVDTGLSKVEMFVVLYQGGSDYLVQVNDTLPTTDGKVKVLVRENIEQAVDEGGTSSYTIGGEVSNGSDISSLTFIWLAIGS